MLLYLMLYFSICLFVTLWLFVFVFFFKQKTAYEMRISDWSSDVCSSDLPRGRSMGGTPRAAPSTSFRKNRLTPLQAISTFPLVITVIFPWKAQSAVPSSGTNCSRAFPRRCRTATVTGPMPPLERMSPTLSRGRCAQTSEERWVGKEGG